ncbi:SGNH/GDSL hydrolase family protein [Spirosoma montaniterrae]|uniref:GDSL family lipase n=1 Tax=Spirosoma montaniterrae TaxID=1178516 RepID=A0A1P9X4N9_9BACT|nr:SGNH/GDSL hydrolase family protein [Spirosoma montaniterrae]AQG82581.1 GDSL family lipase [Spirosoma montaniterrae]
MELIDNEIKQLVQRVRVEPPGSIVFYGSSTIRLWETLEQDFSQLHLLNLGFGGSTLAACAWHFERLVVPAQPRAVILYAGDNDLGENRQPEEVYLFFCALAEKMQRYLPGVPVWFISIKPSPARWSIIEHIQKANTLIASEIARLPNAEFLDLSAMMLTGQGQPRTELYQPDGLHLNANGYALWRDQLMQRCDALRTIQVEMA